MLNEQILNIGALVVSYYIHQTDVVFSSLSFLLEKQWR